MRIFFHLIKILVMAFIWSSCATKSPTIKDINNRFLESEYPEESFYIEPIESGFALNITDLETEIKIPYLRDIKITEVFINSASLYGLKNINLEKVKHFEITLSKISDIENLKYSNPKKLKLFEIPMKDMSFLSNMTNLEYFEAINLDVELPEMAKLKRLKEIWLSGSKVSDLSPLIGTQLESVGIDKTLVQNLSPLVHLPLKSIVLSTIKPSLDEVEIVDFNPDKYKNIELLKTIPTLEEIDMLSIEDFWEYYSSNRSKGTKINRLSTLKSPFLVASYSESSVHFSITIRDIEKEEMRIIIDTDPNRVTNGEIFLNIEDLRSGQNSLNIFELKILNKYLEIWLKGSIQLNDEPIVFAVKKFRQNIEKLIKQKE